MTRPDPDKHRHDDSNESLRLAALRRYRVLDTLPEQAFDDIVRLASLICGTPIALVSLVDADRQWFKARVGLDDEETPRSMSFCSHAIRDPGQVMVVPDALQDRRFADNPLVTGGPRIRFYAGMPLVTPDGQALGSVCVIDAQPRRLDQAQLEGLQALARQASLVLELRQRNLELQRRDAERELLTLQLQSQQEVLRSDNDALALQARLDPLTGLLNRSGLAEAHARARADLATYAGPFSLAVLDIDHFKRVNDSHGHAAGDLVIRALADEIRSGVRQGDVVARYGGEEFLVVMPGTGLEGAVLVIERIREAMARRRDLPLPVTVSVGLAGGIAGKDSPDAVFQRADQALYRAKRGGRNRVEVAEE